MPSRIVREGILDSVLVNALSEEAELFYRRLMSITDDAGRFDDRPELIRARCFPLKLEQWPLDRVKKCLSEVSISRTVDGHVSDSGQPLVTRYRINGRKYLQINNFGQRLRVSKFPGPDDDGAIIEQCPSDDGHESVNRQHQSEAQAESYAQSEAESHPSSNDDGGSFETWYETYPRKVGKVPGRKAFHAVIVNGRLPAGAVAEDMDGLKGPDARFDRLMDTSEAWAAEFERREPDKRPHPATFINSLNWIKPPETAIRSMALANGGMDGRSKAEQIRDRDRETITREAEQWLLKRGFDLPSA